jgi:ribosomal 30S subunit maturation factor RimM
LVHLRIWELLADTLLWLQLGLICSGFGLMGYLAFKVFPDSSDSEASHKSPHSFASQKRELIMLGGYRFEVTQDSTAVRPKVIEFAPSQIDCKSAVR